MIEFIVLLDSRLLRLCNWSVLLQTVLLLLCYREVVRIVSRWPLLAD